MRDTAYSMYRKQSESTSSGAKNETTLMTEEPTLPVNNFILVTCIGINNTRCCGLSGYHSALTTNLANKKVLDKKGKHKFQCHKSSSMSTSWNPGSPLNRGPWRCFQSKLKYLVLSYFRYQSNSWSSKAELTLESHVYKA